MKFFENLLLLQDVIFWGFPLLLLFSADFDVFHDALVDRRTALIDDAAVVFG